MMAGAVTKPERIGDILVNAGDINEEMLDLSLQEQKVTGEKLGSILVRNGFIAQARLIEVIRDSHPSQISSEYTLVTRCPPSILVETKTVVIAEDRDKVFLGTLSRESTVRRLMEPYYSHVHIEFVTISVDAIESYIERLRTINSETSSKSDEILNYSMLMDASDIHIEPRKQTYSVYLRRNGVREHTFEGSLEEYQTIQTQIKLRSNLDIAQRDLPQDGSFQMEFNGRFVDCRVATMPVINGEKIVIRLLDPDKSQPNLVSLGISNVDQWRKGVSLADGICLICGPTGSGKTTTLNASIREMDRFGKSISSLEDPVEYEIQGVSQTTVNPATGLTFARGLKAKLRGDIDVSILGEIRDIETATEAVKGAETGHMVIGTLHTGSIQGSIERLRDIGIDPRDMRHLIRSILVQRLVRTVCGLCNGGGCRACNNKGYTGRTVVSECQFFSSADQIDRVIAGERWWPSMIENAVELMKKGITTASEVERVFGELGRMEIVRRGLTPASSDASEASQEEQASEVVH